MPKKNSFPEYVKDKLYDQIFDRVDSYVKYNAKKLDLTSERIYSIHETYVDDIDIKYVHVEDKEGMRIDFYPFVVVTAIISGKTKYDIEQEDKTLYLRLHCTGDLGKNLSDFRIIDISVYDSKLNRTDAMTDHLVPYIKPENLEERAQRILRQYYPEALTGTDPVDPYILAQRMGLTVHKHAIVEDGSIFGQIYFHDTITELYSRKQGKMRKGRVAANTVVIDKNATILQAMRSEKITVAHECVHFALHRKAFELERLCNENFTKIQCQTTGDISGIDRESETSWMEWQANALAPRLVMPYEAFKKKAEEVILDTMSEVGESELIEVLEEVIDRLAAYFDVPRAAAKARMVEVGYEEARGTYTYIDGRYVRPYRTSKRGLVSENTTFCVPADFAGIAMITKPELYTRVREGRYQYVDSHLVLNTPKYLRKNTKGEMELTQYARYHIEECCLAFNIEVENKTLSNRYFTFCVLNRDKDVPYSLSYTFNGGIQNSAADKQWEYLDKKLAEEREVLGEMPNKFSDAMAYLKKWRGMTNLDIANSIYMSEKQIERIMRGEGTKLETLVSVCLALGLPPEISEEVLRKGGFAFNQSEQHWKLRRLLMFDFGKSMDEIFTIAARNGIELGIQRPNAG